MHCSVSESCGLNSFVLQKSMFWQCSCQGHGIRRWALSESRLGDVAPVGLVPMGERWEEDQHSSPISLSLVCDSRNEMSATHKQERSLCQSLTTLTLTLGTSSFMMMARRGKTRQRHGCQQPQCWKGHRDRWILRARRTTILTETARFSGRPCPKAYNG